MTCSSHSGNRVSKAETLQVTLFARQHSISPIKFAIAPSQSLSRDLQPHSTCKRARIIPSEHALGLCCIPRLLQDLPINVYNLQHQIILAPGLPSITEEHSLTVNTVLPMNIQNQQHYKILSSVYMGAPQGCIESSKRVARKG